MSDEKLGVAIKVVDLESGLSLVRGYGDDRPKSVVESFQGVKFCVRVTVGYRVVHFVDRPISDGRTNVCKWRSKLVVVG